jgi:hypothetical protein
MLVELCNRSLPYSSLYLTPIQVALAVSDRQLCPTLDSPNYPPDLIELIDACLQHDPSLRPHFLSIVARLQAVLAAVERVEASQSSASQNSLFGRVSGVIQGVAHQAQAAATGIQRDPSRIWGQSSSGSFREPPGAGMQTPRTSGGVPPQSPAGSTNTHTFPSPRPGAASGGVEAHPPQATGGWQIPQFMRSPQPPPLRRPSTDGGAGRPPPAPAPTPRPGGMSTLRPAGPTTPTPAAGAGAQMPGMPGIGRLASKINSSPMFQGFMARAGSGRYSDSGRP